MGTKIKVYDLVTQILTDMPATRDSDKTLIFEFMVRSEVLVSISTDGYHSLLDPQRFFEMPSLEAITRTRRKIQQLHPELRASTKVRKARAAKAEQKGTHIYREEIEVEMPPSFNKLGSKTEHGFKFHRGLLDRIKELIN